MRLDKFLANSGIGSRKEVKELIKQGLVFVNDERIINSDINKVENNIELEDGYICKKAKIKRLSKNELYISITEGKFHQVKRMFKAVGNEVIFLKRVRMANILLDKNLKSGEYRELTEDELKGLI